MDKDDVTVWKLKQIYEDVWKKDDLWIQGGIDSVKSSYFII